MKPLLNPSSQDLTLEGLLYALSDPIRLTIVSHLMKKPSMSCAESCAGLRLSKATLSRHYDILRSSGVVFTEKNGAQYTNRVRKDELNRRFPGVLQAIIKSFTKECSMKD
jgi:DNA-binding transcriptional ArsR family regulator